MAVFRELQFATDNAQAQAVLKMLRGVSSAAS
jgi:hypothetical protein